jgi:hypothetical protein
METNGALRIPIVRDRGVGQKPSTMPAYRSFREQWQGLTASERIKKTLFLASVLMAGLYYLFIGGLLLVSYLG